MQQGEIVLTDDVSGGLPIVAVKLAGFPEYRKYKADVVLVNIDLLIMRVLDICLSMVALLLLSPIMLVIAAAVMCEGDGPTLFGHRRVGKEGKTFDCLKFRTMVANAEDNLRQILDGDPALQREWNETHKLRNDPRVTRVGRFLRQSSLDEIPQLFNVLTGDMSLVGPRPIVEAEIVRYGRYYRAYCAVTPGVTGLWQISGRSDVSYRRRVACDTVYSQRRSAWLYIVILARTPIQVLMSRGSY